MKINRNPLGVVLGAFLSAERQRISPDLKSNKLAHRLDIGDSLYRMIESGNARIHPKNFLKFINVFEASRIEHGAFCRLLIAIQYLDSFLDSPQEFQKALSQLKSNDERYVDLVNSLQPLINAIISGTEDFKDILHSGAIVDKVRNFLSQPDALSNDIKEIQHEKFIEIFEELPTIYYSFVDNTIQDLMTLPLAFRSGDLWKWEKHNRSNFKYLYAISKDIDSIIGPANLSRYKYEFLWSANFIEAHIIFLGNHDEKKLKNDFSSLLKKSLEQSGDSYLIPDLEASLKKLLIHCVNLNEEDTTQIFIDCDPNDQTETTDYNIAWVFELNKRISVGLKAKIVQEEWKLQEGISLNWNKTSNLYKTLKKLIKKGE